MKKILTLCILLLVLVPATVMAAGAHGQGKSGAGAPALGIGEQSLESTPACGQNRFCTMNGEENADQYRFAEMHRVSAGRGIGDQVRIMARNQTRLRDGSCGNCPVQTG
ncbi:MAG: hypothetical protein QHH04_04305 [Methanolinea sp.]|nr:hypothetical protein [Methanolinea sp.]